MPAQGLGTELTRLHQWLVRVLGPGGFAVHSARTIASDALGMHFREVEAARACVAAFPDLKVADATTSLAYPSPVLPMGGYETKAFGVCNLYSMTTTQEAMRVAWPPRRARAKDGEVS